MSHYPATPAEQLREMAVTLYATGKYDRPTARRIAREKATREAVSREVANREKPAAEAVQ